MDDVRECRLKRMRLEVCHSRCVVGVTWCLRLVKMWSGKEWEMEGIIQNDVSLSGFDASNMRSADAVKPCSKLGIDNN